MPNGQKESWGRKKRDTTNENLNLTKSMFFFGFLYIKYKLNFKLKQKDIKFQDSLKQQQVL